ncbi:MAG: FimV/HubP family polar landmark protein [Sulfuricaulis sp.]
MALFSRWMLVGIMALFPAVGHALALGKLKVLSALNEPLNAEIEFTSITDKELKGLSVALASRADFDAAGVERLPFLSQVKFVIDQRPDGRHFLQLRTDQQIDEPFLHLLLQVEWPGGRLVREYTALIDPPYKIAGKAAPVETPVVIPPAPEPVPAPMPELEPAPAPMAEAPPADMMKEEIPPVAAAPEELKAPEEPKAEEVPPKEEVAQEIPPPAEAAPQEKFGPPDVATGMAPEEPGAPMVEPLEAAPTAETAPEAQPAAEPEAAPALAQMTDYHVQRGDTLWRIAEKARADNRDASIEQMILAIYRTNQDAFFGNNVNNLKAGKILKMPEREEVESTTTSEARREFRAQYSAWQEYKLRLASASGAVQVPEAPEVAPEEPAPAPPAPEPAKEAAKPSKPAPTATDKAKQDELLKIVRSTLQQEKSTPDQKVAEKESAQETATREQQALADRAATLEESLESKRLENKELSDKVGVVRSQLSKESRLIELESQDLAQQPKPTEPKPVEPAAKPAESAPKPAETATAPVPEQQAKIEPLPPAKPAPTPRKRAPLPPPPPPEEKDFLATVLEAVQSDLLVPAVIGIVVLLSGGIALVYFRRRQKSIAEFEESILSADAISTESPATTGTVVGQQAAAVTTGGDTSFLSDFSQGGMGNIHTDEVDPIAEAEVYLAYGRDETAEEILKEAMVKNPDRQEIKLKLLEIYHQRNDVSAFETLAEELYAAQGGRGGKVWDKVEEMGRKLNPDNPMFRGGAPGKGTADATPAKSAAVTKPVSAATTATASAGVDFQASATETAKTEMAGDFDFDIETPATEAAKPADSGDDFSVMMPESPPKAREEAGLESLDLGGAADSGLDFDIGGGETSDAPAGNEIKWEPEPAAPAAGAEEILDAAAAPAGDGEGSAQWDEAATKLDLAKAYIDMGDAEGARSILQEVMAEGSEAQKKQAQELSAQIA